MSLNDGFDWGSGARGGRGRRRRVEREIGVLPISPSEALEPYKAPSRHRPEKIARMHPVAAFLNRTMTLLVIGFFLMGAVFYYVKLQFDQAGPLGHSTVVVIPPGEGVKGIAQRLEKQNVISDRHLFIASVMYFRAQKKLKAGEYEIRRGASMRQVLDTISQGRSVLHKLTIPEGLTSLQALARIEEHEMLSGVLSQIPEEGTLLPDTYKFTRGMSRRDLISRMQAEQQNILDALWDRRQAELPFSTREEAIILASIVEKETGRSDERRRVASVFINRLRRGMRLQSDPTIIYGLVGGKGSLGRPILKSEIAKETPYNTYRIDGLPPGPIANPGRAAIEAVLNPAQTNDLYFVADGTGGHVFAETLQQHQKNVVNWRKIEKEIRARQAQAKKDSEALSQSLGGGSGLVPGSPVETITTQSLATVASGNETEQTTVQTVVGRSVPIPVRKPVLR